MNISTDRVRIGKLYINRASMPQIVDHIPELIETNVPRHFVTVNMNFLSRAEKDASFTQVVNNADLSVADGKPLVWLSKILGTTIPERITGHDLVHAFSKMASVRGYSVFFMGAGPGVAEGAAIKLRSLYPGLKVAGSFCGMFTKDGYGVTEEDEQGAIEAIRKCKPNFVFVAMGCPKQEFWIHNHLHMTDANIFIGIGGVLDVLAGRVRRAPNWMQRSGLEWAFRLKQEPKRLWERYLLEDLPTGTKIALSGLARGVPILKNAKARGSQPGPA